MHIQISTKSTQAEAMSVPFSRLVATVQLQVRSQRQHDMVVPDHCLQRKKPLKKQDAILSASTILYLCYYNR